MSRCLLQRLRRFGALACLACAAIIVHRAEAQTPAPTAEIAAPAKPGAVIAVDRPWDGGASIDVTWELSPDDANRALLTGYRISRSRNAAELEAHNSELIAIAVRDAKRDATKAWREQIAAQKLSPTDPAQIKAVRELRQQAAEKARAAAQAAIDANPDQSLWRFLTIVPPGTGALRVDELAAVTELPDGTVTENSYRFMVEAIGQQGVRSAASKSEQAVTPKLQWFAGYRLWLAIIMLVLCGSVVAFILMARTGMSLKVRKIAGLEAVDEAVGRATEMGRSCLFIPGIQDMNDIQTIAGITVLSRVAKTAAEYDARIEVPTSRSLVMTTARETVQSAFLAAGRPDAYNEDLIYYVTDEQFGYVAYLSGMMVREKPAACFYMGSFFAESLILAETGNSIGAIQVAGTAQPAQLPFFVAACDYTLIGEEFFAASAYLSGSPEELGSLKGQDVGKLIVAIGIIVGVFCASVASVGVLTSNPALTDMFGTMATFIRETMLT